MKRDRRGLFAGVVLIVVGTVFLIDRLDIADLHEVAHNWWPMLIVLFGVSRLFYDGRRWSGVSIIAIGGWLQAVQMQLYGVTFDNSWPLLLIFVGGSITLRAIAQAVMGKEGRRES